MKEPDRPSFSDEVYESIQREQYKVHQVYWDLLNPLGVSALGLIGPLQPKQPLYLKSTLGNYACELFNIETKRYPADDRQLPQWLATLARRIEAIILAKLAELTRSTGLLMHSMEYHLAKNEIVEAIRTSLAKRIETYVSRSPTQPTPVRSKVAVIDEGTRIRQAKGLNATRDHVKSKRFTGIITSQPAARRMEDDIERKGLELTDFAAKAGTTDRTLRSFRKTGRVRHDISMASPRQCS
jgi:hypothetical protein